MKCLMQRHVRSPHRRLGMTLVEVLAVVVILGIIATALSVGFSGTFGKAKAELAKTGIAQIVQKLELYRIEHDAWPDLSMGLAALSEGQASPSDPYFLEPNQLLDPWKRPFHFVTPGPGGRPFEVLSLGADGVPGGDGENRDISSAGATQ